MAWCTIHSLWTIPREHLQVHPLYTRQVCFLTGPSPPMLVPVPSPQIPSAEANGAIPVQDLPSLHPHRQRVRTSLVNAFVCEMTAPLAQQHCQHVTSISWLGPGQAPCLVSCHTQLLHPSLSLTHLLSCRHVVCSVRECFYRPDTWEGCDVTAFSARAQSCALQSLRNLHATAEDSGSPTPHHVLLPNSCFPCANHR